MLRARWSSPIGSRPRSACVAPTPDGEHPLLQLAEWDLQDGHSFYESRSTGVGEYFLDALTAEIDSLVLFAGVHRQVRGYHRMLSRRFPYAVYYKVDVEWISVWRVLDLRRDPAWIKRQLRS